MSMEKATHPQPFPYQGREPNRGDLSGWYDAGKNSSSLDKGRPGGVYLRLFKTDVYQVRGGLCILS